METGIYKLCPECQTPAQVNAASCSKCGHIFRSQYMPPPAGLPPQQALYTPPPPRRTSTGLWVLLAALASFAVLLAVAVVLALAKSGQEPPPETASGQPPAPDTSSPGGVMTRGMFRERPSQQEMPTVVVENEESDVLTLRFTSADGRQYELHATAGSPGSVQLPAGDYSVYLSSSDPTVEDNSGTAVFRRYRSYQASFHVVDYPVPPIRMGDE